MHRPTVMRGRPLVPALAFFLALALTSLAAPPVTVACSCAFSEHPMQEAAAGNETSVFTGVAGPLEPDGVRVALTRWFHGAPPPDGIAMLDPSGFVDPNGGSCGTNPPPAGTEWIFAAWRDETGRFSMNLCSTAAALETDQGRNLITEALAVFGEPIVLQPTDAPPATGDDVAATLSSILPTGIAILVGVALLVGVLALIGRRED